MSETKHMSDFLQKNMIILCKKCKTCQRLNVIFSYIYLEWNKENGVGSIIKYFYNNNKVFWDLNYCTKISLVLIEYFCAQLGEKSFFLALSDLTFSQWHSNKQNLISKVWWLRLARTSLQQQSDFFTWYDANLYCFTRLNSH